MQRIYNLHEVAELLQRNNETVKQSRRRVLDLCRRGELQYKPNARYNKWIKECDLQAFLNKGYGFHKRPAKKRTPDRAKELAKAEIALRKLQATVDSLKSVGR